MKKETVRKIFAVSVFAIAMAFLEAAVVIYLRKLFYPAGFVFPLIGFVEPSILSVEWLREFATIAMLISVGILAGKKFCSRIAYFLYAFAVWDIFYYIFLKLALNWPSSFLTWDLLFLVPWPWAGPVIAPIICSILFIILAILILNFEDKNKKAKPATKEWLLFVGGVLLVLYTWLYDYGALIFGGGFAKSFFTLAENLRFIDAVSNFIPAGYNWLLFSAGIVLTIIGIVLFYLRTTKSPKLK